MIDSCTKRNSVWCTKQSEKRNYDPNLIWKIFEIFHIIIKYKIILKCNIKYSQIVLYTWASIPWTSPSPPFCTPRLCPAVFRFNFSMWLISVWWNILQLIRPLWKQAVMLAWIMMKAGRYVGIDYDESRALCWHRLWWKQAVMLA